MNTPYRSYNIISVSIDGKQLTVAHIPRNVPTLILIIIFYYYIDGTHLLYYGNFNADVNGTYRVYQ